MSTATTNEPLFPKLIETFREGLTACSEFVAKDVIPGTGLNGLMDLPEDTRIELSKKMSLVLSMEYVLRESLAELRLSTTSEEDLHRMAEASSLVFEESGRLKRLLSFAAYSAKTIH